jgi:hypothetical protein
MEQLTRQLTCCFQTRNYADFCDEMSRAREIYIPNSFSSITNQMKYLYRKCVDKAPDTRYAEELCKLLDADDLEMSDVMTDIISWTFPMDCPRNNRDREKMLAINVLVSYLEKIRTSQKTKSQLETFRSSLNYESIMSI